MLRPPCVEAFMQFQEHSLCTFPSPLALVKPTARVVLDVMLHARRRIDAVLTAWLDDDSQRAYAASFFGIRSIALIKAA